MAAAQSSAHTPQVQLPALLSLARATRNYLMAGRVLAMRRVAELESVLELLRDKVEEADVWVGESHQQVGDVLNAMAAQGIHDGITLSDNELAGYLDSLTDDEFSHHEGVTDSDNSDDPDNPDDLDCISNGNL